MRICIGGKNQIAIDVCQYLLDTYPNIPISIIPNQTDSGIDCGKSLSFKSYALKRGLSILSLADIYDWEDLVFLSLEFDRLIKPELFSSKRLFNIHFSLLPKYKGMYTSALPILNGESESGVTLHRIDRGIDTGNIIAQEAFKLDTQETCFSLYQKYLLVGSMLVINNIGRLLQDDFFDYPQPVNQSTYFSKSAIDYSHLIIDVNQTADMIDRQVRAYHFREFQIPYIHGFPISHTVFTNARSTFNPGTILENCENYLKLATIDYDILLYKDRFSDLMEYVKNGDYEQFLSVPHISKYINEREKGTGHSLLEIALHYQHNKIVDYINGLYSQDKP